MGELTIRLKSDMCAGNGESVGYGIDSDICTDNYGFPYIPGKRIMGCLRDVALQLKEYGLVVKDDEGQAANIDKLIDGIFGTADGREGILNISNATISNIDSLHSYIDMLKKEDGKKDYLIRQCTEEKIIRAFSNVRGQTRIDERGKAKAGSLRFIRVLNHYNPFDGKELEFKCDIDVSKLNKEQVCLVENSCKAFRHMGLNRNRGLGNIEVVLDKSDYDEKQTENAENNIDMSYNNGEQIMLSYQVEFDSPITVQEYLEDASQIKARTMIGMFSSLYLRDGKNADEIFEKLFLDGTVKWSSLTPVINGITSDPVSAMIMKLKNGNGKLINSFACDDKDWKKKKPKSMDGYYASYSDSDKILYVSQPESETSYHNRMNVTDKSEGTKGGLYMQDSLKQGMIYGGYVILPKDMLQVVSKLLSVRSIRFGRSKKAQYGMATIKNIKASGYSCENVQLKDGEAVFAILLSDLVLQKDAAIQIDNSYVRQAISEVTGLENIITDGFNDLCRYHVITGYNNMWHMQKPKIQAVMGGSVYCFRGKSSSCPSEIIIGEYQQEGLGRIKLVPMSKLKEMSNVSYGDITSKRKDVDSNSIDVFHNMLLFKAAMTEIGEYAFVFKKADDKKKYNERILKSVPSGRLRQMLQDSDKISDLRKMVESMKTSDVSSDSKGKKENTIKLLNDFYGDALDEISLDKIIRDKELLKEIAVNKEVHNMVQQQWKEPLYTLLHMMHYNKSRG